MLKWDWIKRRGLKGAAGGGTSLGFSMEYIVLSSMGKGLLERDSKGQKEKSDLPGFFS